MTKKILRVPRPERATPAEKVDGLEKACLSGAIPAVEVVPAWGQVDIDVGKTADGANPEALKGHLRPFCEPSAAF